MTIATADPTAEAHPRYLTAIHEAGHAVAAVMRGGGELTSITIDPTEDYDGHTQIRAKSFDAGFICYAGIWAEARQKWGMRALDAIDDEGCEFEDYIGGVMLCQPEDMIEVIAQEQFWEYLAGLPNFPVEAGAKDSFVSKNFQDWQRELEGMWTVVQSVASRLVRGETVDHDTVYGLVEAQ